MSEPLINVSLYHVLGVLIVLYGHLGIVKGREVCYNPLGCFSDEQPWSCTPERPLAALPWSPEKINTRFFLHTRQNRWQHQIISARNLASIKASAFRTNRNTHFIVHGMGDKAEKNWVPKMCKAILEEEDANCIGVDWHDGSGWIFIYVQALNNARVVGAEVAYLLKVLWENLRYPASKVHLIGHSLGAHVAGEVGRRHQGIARITGLDPARHYFENAPAEVRLDSTDAAFVDVIHTDTGPLIGLGIMMPIGHLDFYPNGGKRMIGCPNKLVLIESVLCHHLRAVDYYLESIKSPEGFLGYPCDSYNSFSYGSCFPCPKSGCSLMGHFSQLPPTLSATPQIFYLNTGGSISRLSRWRYKVSVTLYGTRTFKGRFYVILPAARGATWEYEIVRNGPSYGNTFSGFIDLELSLGRMNHVTCKWKPILLNLFSHQFGAQRIEIQSGKDGKVSAFCGSGTVREGVVQKLTLC
ncbi:pancreatic lipase-related protein 2 isoform X2 [Xenopus laevis]|uniref:Triacylglycerol lipase n=2 Tax=Xenopus laevis TaxID=8355 RepID=A0A1L8FI96_XENLA|nr:pancreatic lipase-related protein 2 isoform X2 [Xenopus laevis]OCT71303.1 hypothetical protein XELAEV_18034281mg [Xenopus laevis]